MRRFRFVLLALAALAAAPAHAQAPAGETAAEAAAASSAGAPVQAAAPAVQAPAPVQSFQREAPPRTLRAYAHVFVAFAIAWALLFGYLVFIARKFRGVEEQLAALARS